MRRRIRQPGIVAVEQKAAVATAGIVAGAGQQDEMFGLGGAGDEPLAATDNVIAAVPFGAGQHHAGIGPSARGGFGHHEGRADAAFGDGAQPAVLLPGGAQGLQDHHVAVVRRGRVEDHRPEDRTVHLFIADGHADARKTLAAILGRQLQAPQPFGTGQGAQIGQQGQGDVLMRVIAGRIGFQRQQPFRYKGGDAAPVILDPRRNGEVHEGPLQA